ncbi:MAG: DNA polymerase IV [Candidatus Verstraetearchaeota archaeon]|nr:DNA polymerase IV [Candidatus Verstraetearchaeota archaeon]
MEAPGRIVILADIDYFYSQAEERRHPELVGKPLVVCVYSGRSEESGVVATANYEARRHGVRSGMPISLAKRRLEGVEAAFFPVDFAYYRQLSDRVMAILKEHADEFEQVGIDEAYLDISGRVSGYNEGEELGRELKRRVREEEGLKITIGIGPNKLIAKMASDASKPDGLRAVRPEGVAAFISPLPVDAIPGVGKKTGERLGELGIRTIGELAGLSQARLIEEFGEALGRFLFLAAKGIDNDPVQGREELGSMSRIVTLKEDTRDMSVISLRINEICEEIHRRAAREGVLYRNVGIIAIHPDLTMKSRTKSLPAPTNDLQLLKRSALELAGKYIDETPKELRRIGVHISGFTRMQKGQKDLSSYL